MSIHDTDNQDVSDYFCFYGLVRLVGCDSNWCETIIFNLINFCKAVWMSQSIWKVYLNCVTDGIDALFWLK